MQLVHIHTHFMLTWLVAALFISPPAAARRKFERRSDLTGSPLSQSGWTVPLQGGQTCRDSDHCTNSLQPPSSSYDLLYLGLARGVITYDCANVTTGHMPIYVKQDTLIYNVVPLIPKFASESEFHAFVPLFLNYDYTELDNSTLTCIASITTADGLSVVDVFDVDAFAVTVQEDINPPSDPLYNLDWARSVSLDGQWEVYRVETAAGAAPVKCTDELEIQVQYAAEYWFYKTR